MDTLRAPSPLKSTSRSTLNKLGGFSVVCRNWFCCKKYHDELSCVWLTQVASEIVGSMKNAFKWRHYEGSIILLCVRWYLRYALSYRDLAEMMAERG